ncbi:amidohydrolase family protein [Labrys neptuniae]|uniref:amidohydrolase family protein n=1 Tax=Labrys neptuniae TaxID=376174 RepID=UPI00288D8EA9|nr:amidohydrolase family protein [Labrys neptuniae]MDT3375792.1 amidohydrolase family protein [Labrys neptuniae]
MNIPPADLLIRNARLPTSEEPVHLAIRDEAIAAIGRELRCEAVEIVDAEGALACGGFVDSHIHLDKACILDRCRICEGTLAEAVRETARAKASFTEADVYARAARVVERAIIQGTMAMRSFVEVDPRAGLRSFEAIKRVRRDYAFAIDIEICAFVQEGLTNEPETLGLLNEALAGGADLVGGAPYTDPDPAGQISLIFDLAQAHGVAADFHLDFDLAPEKSNLPVVLKETIRRGWQGRVSLGHMTSLSARPSHEVEAIATGLREAGIAVVALPATDLFLNGREYERLVPRGVAPTHILALRGVNASIATNNILNPFTPFGDASLLRMANLYANVVQLSRTEHLRLVFDMIGPLAARGMRRASGLSVGAAADILLIDCVTPEQAIRENSRVIRGWKRGRPTFRTTRPEIIRRDY